VHTHVDWHEQDSLLKLAWPVDVHTDHADYEIEMGHITRPTHTNTSWELDCAGVAKSPRDADGH
jgi:alpha-mannosidase